MNTDEMKIEIDRLIVELKSRVSNFEARERNHEEITEADYDAWVSCTEAVKRAGGYIEGYNLNPDMYPSILKKLQNAAAK